MPIPTKCSECSQLYYPGPSGCPSCGAGKIVKESAVRAPSKPQPKPQPKKVKTPVPPTPPKDRGPEMNDYMAKHLTICTHTKHRTKHILEKYKTQIKLGITPDPFMDGLELKKLWAEKDAQKDIHSDVSKS